MHRIGIMQGRLSPARGGAIQSFPTGTWKEEFPRARQAGLCCIEWIYEQGTETENPISTEDGIVETRRLARAWDIAVDSVCADYFMAHRLVSPSGSADRNAVSRLEWLIAQAAGLGACSIVLPFVDESSLVSPQQVAGLQRILQNIVPIAEDYRIELHLETDLPPRDLLSLLSTLDHPFLRANYDIGNSASLGRDPAFEFLCIGRYLGSVHVKDRSRGGGSVPLGTGAADFPLYFRLIRGTGFKGPYILQTARDTSVSEVELAQRNRQFVEHHLQRAIQEST